MRELDLNSYLTPKFIPYVPACIIQCIVQVALLSIKTRHFFHLFIYSKTCMSAFVLSDGSYRKEEKNLYFQASQSSRGYKQLQSVINVPRGVCRMWRPRGAWSQGSLKEIDQNRSGWGGRLEG